MARILVVGLPRSGTTWLARTLALTPGAVYVHEPDNRRVDPFAYVGTRGLSVVPSPEPGRRADDLRLMWAVAFNGGRPQSGVIGTAGRLGAHEKIPRAVRIPLLRSAARMAARRPPSGTHQIVKSVYAYLSLEWIDAEFDPSIVVVWRHPLNLAPAWVDHGWTSERAGPGQDTVHRRFGDTGVWPPPEGEGLMPAAWSACARSALLLEAAAKHPDWLVVLHEQQSLDPEGGFRRLFAALDLVWTDDVGRALQEADRPGEGYATQRRSSDEALRWKQRLTAEEQDAVASLVRRFEEASPVAAGLWRSSAAVAG